jgi:hypothetical protein
MALIPTPKAVFTEVFAGVVKALGVQHPNNPEGDVVNPNSPHTSTAIKNWIALADVEIARIICETQDHPYRNAYFTAVIGDFVELSDGDRIPNYLGVHGWVKVKGKSETAFDFGVLAQSLAHVQRHKEKTTRKLYFIHNGQIFLYQKDAKAKVEVPSISRPDTAGDPIVLASPYSYQVALIAFAVCAMPILGFNSNIIEKYQQLLNMYENQIRGKSLSLPEPERMERVAT